jgi:hypothetical protein
VVSGALVALGFAAGTGDTARSRTLRPEVCQAVADLPIDVVVLVEDETHINLLPWVRPKWVARGSRQRVRPRGKIVQGFEERGLEQLLAQLWCDGGWPAAAMSMSVWRRGL